MEDNWAPTFCVGQHETERTVPVSSQLVHFAYDCNYDVVTSPITTSHFHSRVLTLLSAHMASLKPPTQDHLGTVHTSSNTVPLSIPPLLPEDSVLRPEESNSHVVGVTSRWIDLCSPDPLIADISRQILLLELAYAAFCGVSYIMVPGPKLHHGNLHGDGLIFYARAIQELINIAPYVQINIWLPMVDSPDLETNEIGDLAPFARREYAGETQPEVYSGLDVFGTWNAWNTIRTVCKYQSRLVVALSVPKQLPPSAVQSRWHSEPVRMLTFPSTSFIKNQKGYPVLSKAHQALIARFMRLRIQPWIILCDVGPIPGIENINSQSSGQAVSSPTPAEASGSGGNKKNIDPTPHLSYVRNLQQKQPARSPMEKFGTGYQDYLQAPLQPLTVNLESITYEVFEKDPIKYEWYERAITKALRDWAAEKKPTSNPDGRVVLAVVGAGRGPLVSRAIRASVEAGVDIDVWALEKNPNAFVHLQRQNQNVWGGSVTLVKNDMRSWKGPHRVSPQADTTADSSSPSATTHIPVDILVSELLGSFGDNELSPECLDGANHLLNPVHGISIPSSYSAHLTPISAPRLHADVTNQTTANPAAPETPYVVLLHAIDYLSTTSPPAASASRPGTSTPNSASSSTATLQTSETETTPIVKTAWSFSHPNSNIPESSISSSNPGNAHNLRQTRLSFPCREGGTCHGLGGYFETVLYKDVELSTNPVTMESKSAGMISWFPIYFPLKTPLYVPENSEVVITMYRQTDDRKVWYEWVVEVFKFQKQEQSSDDSTPQSKKNDLKKIRIAMSDFHSSIKDGCLM